MLVAVEQTSLVVCNRRACAPAAGSRRVGNAVGYSPSLCVVYCPFRLVVDGGHLVLKVEGAFRCIGLESGGLVRREALDARRVLADVRTHGVPDRAGPAWDVLRVVVYKLGSYSFSWRVLLCTRDLADQGVVGAHLVCTVLEFIDGVACLARRQCTR